MDSGGQPQFREMLPVLVQMATACVLTLRLNVPLGKLNEVECVEKGKELCKPYLSVLTNEQIVKHCSQIVDSQTKDCKLFVVGTHQDLEHKCQTETRTSKNKKLLKPWQPQFREMLPILVKMATACVLTLKLNVPLGKLNEVECVERGKELCKPYLSVLTNEQIVKHCSQIVDCQTKDCRLFVVGTHHDLEHECWTETRSDKNEKLLKLLQPQLGTNLEVYKTGDPVEVIFPVNSKTPKERDYCVVEQFRRAVHTLASSKEKVDIRGKGGYSTVLVSS